MKKIICGILIAAILLCTGIACASAPAPSNALFTYISDAMNLLSAGAYDRVVASVPFADAAPSADEWRNFALGNFATLTNTVPQNRYIVVYWSGSVWKVAMPVQEPSSDDVEVLVLSSEDGESFIGYGCSLWGNIRREYESSTYVRWTEEYHNTTSAVIEFDD